MTTVLELETALFTFVVVRRPATGGRDRCEDVWISPAAWAGWAVACVALALQCDVEGLRPGEEQIHVSDDGAEAAIVVPLGDGDELAWRLPREWWAWRS